MSTKKISWVCGAQKRHEDQSNQNQSDLGSQASLDKETTPVFVGKDKFPKKIHIQLKWKDTGFLAISLTRERK